MPDTSSASQAVNVVSDDDEDDQEENTPRHLTTSEAHLDDLLHSFMMENDVTLTGLIAEVTDKIQNIKLSTLKQINIERFSLKS